MHSYSYAVLFTVRFELDCDYGRNVPRINHFELYELKCTHPQILGLHNTLGGHIFSQQNTKIDAKIGIIKFKCQTYEYI